MSSSCRKLPGQGTSQSRCTASGASRAVPSPSLDERRDAVRDLADVLEFIKPQLKQVLAKSNEAELFNIANDFGIRHHRPDQKTDYDKPIFYRWLYYYYYLATIHAGVRLIQRGPKK
jgi:hypothetical protein